MRRWPGTSKSLITAIAFVCMIVLIAVILIRHPDSVGTRAREETLMETSRLLCFVLADANNDVRPAMAVKETWGSRCDAFIFFSTQAIPELAGSSVVVLQEAAEGYALLWGKVRAAWSYLQRHHQEFDWFLKADVDTFVVVENLRHFLNERNPDRPEWYGARLKNPRVTNGYHSGGAGYVLSRAALTAFRDNAKCSRMDFGYEDLELGRCLEKLGIKPGDTRDPFGRETFLPLSVEELLFRDAHSKATIDWYWNSLWWPHQTVYFVL